MHQWWAGSLMIQIRIDSNHDLPIIWFDLINLKGNWIGGDLIWLIWQSKWFDNIVHRCGWLTMVRPGCNWLDLAQNMAGFGWHGWILWIHAGPGWYCSWTWMDGHGWIWMYVHTWPWLDLAICSRLPRAAQGWTLLATWHGLLWPKMTGHGWKNW